VSTDAHHFHICSVTVELSAVKLTVEVTLQIMHMCMADTFVIEMSDHTKRQR